MTPDPRDTERVSYTGRGPDALGPGTVLSARYRIEAELGRGGMGVVYRARDLQLEREVAVKLVPAEGLDTESRQRLLREARAAAALNHPNIVGVYDTGEDAGRPFVVMELVTGGRLREAMPTAIDEILQTAGEICEALHHAHERGIVHRDLKPENLLRSGPDASGRLKLADLGLAVPRGDARITRAGYITGTVAYMAPEQALGGEVDGRADLYALGVLLYEMLAGRPPFTGDDPLAVLSQHVHAPVVPPRAHRPDIPPGLERVVLRLLAKDPGDRYATAQEVAEALRGAPAEEAPGEGTSSSVALLAELARGRLVGREREMGELRDLWGRVREGHGHLALVSGEPGAGKTRLSRELLVYARLDGATVLQGGCYEYEASTPYLPFVEALRRWARTLEDDALRDLLGDAAPQLAKLAPELASRVGPFPESTPLPPHEERLLLFEGVARFLRALAARRGALLYIDDIHWADTGTIGLLGYLLRQLREDRVLFAASYREMELDRSHPLADALVDWNRERLSTRIPLGRMDREGTRALLATLLGEETVSDPFTDAVHAETEGNPFFVEEVLKALIEQGKVYRTREGWSRCEIEDLAIPQGIKATIGHRLDRVGEACNAVLRMGAVLGKTFSFSELAAVAADHTEDALLDALDEGAKAQLIEAGSGESFAFTHDKIREVLYEELNPIRRRRLHLRVAEGLESVREGGGAASVEDLAHHFMEAGDYARGLRYATEAASEAERLYAYDEAVTLYQRALECAEALERPEEIGRLEEAIGNVLNTRGDTIGSGEHFARALETASDPEVRVRLKCRIAAACVAQGDDRCLDYVREALDELDPATHPEDVARAMMIEGRFHHLQGRHRQAVERLESAMDLLGPEADLSLVTMLHMYMAGAYQHLGLFAQSDAWAHRAIEVGTTRNLPMAEAGGYEFLGENSISKGTWEEGLRHANHEREIARRIGSLEREAWTYLVTALAGWFLGDLEGSLGEFTAGRELAVRIEELRLASLLQLFSVLPLTDLGRTEEAGTIAQEALEEAERLGLLYLRAESRRMLAYWHLRGGRPGDFLRLADEVRTLLEPTDACVPLIHLEPLRIRALLDLGRREEAEGALAEYRSLAQRVESPLAERYLKEAETALGAGD